MTINYEIGKPRQDKKMRITFMLCIGKTKKRIKTDLFVTSSDLNRKGKIRNDSPIYKKVIDGIRSLESEYASLDTFLTGETMTAAVALDKMRHTKVPTFFEYAERYVSRLDLRGIRNYKTALNSFKAFTQHDIPFSMFSRPFFNEYIYSLKDKPTAQAMYTDIIKRIYESAEKDYTIKPFSTFQIDMPKKKRAKARAVETDTIRKIFSWNGTAQRAVLARDCAILSFCLCATNSADLYYAPPIKNGILAYDRTKTKDRRYDNAHIEIKIPEQIKDLVRKYRGSSHAFKFHTMYYNEAKFNSIINKGLKTIRDDLKIKDNITFYTFRHSWATIARNELKIDKYTIHDALIHLDKDTLIDDIYIKKDFTLVNEANQKVVDYVFDALTPART